MSGIGVFSVCDGWLETLAPHEPICRHRHDRTDEESRDAQLKRQIVGLDA